ncbi:MAG: hypothetical protein A3K09_01515 [Nitrospinae bacterium RIFCSPLOWO2_12_FULL_47_7]|nr:MAG: hypothetical protein A3K09_01515 [Nitrospinae bacterium RIFCSPLOWO2_12_FULL_47_7]
MRNYSRDGFEFFIQGSSKVLSLWNEKARNLSRTEKIKRFVDAGRTAYDPSRRSQRWEDNYRKRWR